MSKSSAASVIVSLLALSSFGANAATWSELARYRLGGVGGWDLMAVDASSRRLYVTRGDHMMIVDVDNGKVVGDISGLKRAHGVALWPNHHRGYVTSGEDDRVVSFDTDTLKATGEIKITGNNPDAIVFDAPSGHFFVFNGRSNDVTVIDPTSNKVIATMPAPGKPELAVSDGRGNLFFNLEDKGQVAKADAKAAKVETTWTLGDCEEPTGLAIDAEHHRLFSVCANQKMTVIDSNNGRLVATVPIGKGPDGAVFDAHSSTVFSSNSDGTLTAVHEDDPDHYRVASIVPTPPRSRTVALDTKKHQAIVAFAEFEAATPSAPSAADTHARPTMKSDTFGVLVIGRR